MKKFLSIVLAILMVVTTVPYAFAAATVASGTCGADGSNVSWELDSDGVLTFSGEGATQDYSGPSLSPIYYYKDDVKKIVVNDGVTRLGTYVCFMFTEVTEVSLPESLVSIGENVFAYFKALESIELPDSLTTIGIGAFQGCAFKSITIPEGVTTIDASVFQSCQALETVTFHEGLTTIGKSAFYYCDSLKSISIPASVTTIGEGAFELCDSLESVYVPCSWENNPLYSGFGSALIIADHSIEDGVCSACGCDCPHKNITDGKCDSCGTEGTIVTIEMIDSYGDGWNGNAVVIKQLVDGVYTDTEAGTATIEYGAGGTFTTVLPKDGIFALSWLAGDYPSECSFTIAVDGETVYECVDGSTLTDGQMIYVTCEHISYTDGKCNVCGYECPHENYTDGKCDVCGYECPHENYTDGKCDVCGYECTHESYTDGKCDSCGTEGTIVTIDMTDSYGDGWNGNAVVIKQLVDGVYTDTEAGTATIGDGVSGTFTTFLSKDGIFALSWLTGDYPEECSFTIAVDGETVYECADGRTLTDGQMIYVTCEHTSYTDGKCDVCGYECPHKNITDGKCDSCGTEGTFVTIDMTDSYGNGWNGNAVVIKQLVDGVYTDTEAGTATIEYGVSGTFTTVLPKDGIFALSWLTGDYPEDCSFTIAVDGETVYECADGSTLTDGQMIYVTCEHTSYTDSKCDVCGYECTHESYTDSKCDACGYICTHEGQSGSCQFCGANLGKLIIDVTDEQYVNIGSGQEYYDEDGYIITGTNEDASVRVYEGTDLTLSNLTSGNLDFMYATENSVINITLDGKTEIVNVSLTKQHLVFDGGETDTLKTMSFGTSGHSGSVTVNGGNIDLVTEGGYTTINCVGGFIINGGTVTAYNNSTFVVGCEVTLNGGELNINSTSADTAAVQGSITMKKGTLLTFNAESGMLRYDSYVGYIGKIVMADGADETDCFFVRYDKGSDFVPVFDINSALDGKSYAEIKIDTHEHSFDDTDKCICGALLHRCDFSGEWKYDADKHWKECTSDGCDKISEDADHSFADGKCDCGYACPHSSYTDGICDNCDYECPHEETYKDIVRPVQNADGTWGKGKIVEICYTCGYSSLVKEIERDHEGYAAFDAAVAELEALLNSGEVIDGPKNGYMNTLNNLKSMAYSTVYTEIESAVRSMTGTLEGIIATVEAGVDDGTMKKADFSYMASLLDEVKALIDNNPGNIVPSQSGYYYGPNGFYSSCVNNPNYTQASYDSAMKSYDYENQLKALIAGLKDGTMLKADYTVIDEAIAEIEEKLASENVTDEGKAELEEIKTQLEEKKADGNTSKADLAELEKALGDYEAELDKGIEDGTLVKFSGERVFLELAEEAEKKIDEKYGENAFYDFANENRDSFYNLYDKYFFRAASLEGGTMAENAENIEYIKGMVDELFGKAENCIAGTHNYGKGVLTRPTFETAGYYTYTCTLCGHSYTEPAKKADTTALNDASMKVTEYIDNDTLTQEAKDEIYKSYRDILKNNGNIFDELGFVRGDLVEEDQPAINAVTAELEKIIADAEEKIASGEYVKVDGTKEYNKIADALDAELMENYSQEEFAALAEKAGDEINARLGEIIEKAESLTGTVAENKDALTEIESELRALYAEVKNCLDGVHNGFVYEVTEEAKCGVNAIESATCTLCGEADEREVEGTALEHSFTKYEETEAPKCGVAGKKVAYCDNGCQTTDEKEIAALEHIFLDYVSNGDATCTADGTKTASCVLGCGETDTVTDEGTMLDHADEDGDKLCDDCQAEIVDTCPDCGRREHEQTGIPQYICLIITFIRLVVKLVRALQGVA